MSDTAPEPGAAETTAPRSMSSVSVPVSDSSDGGESYNPQQDTAAAFEAFRAAKAAAKPADPAPDPQSKQDVVEAAVADATGTEKPETPASDPGPDPSDAKLNRIFNRIAALEKERDEARSSLSRLEQKASRADELEAKFSKFKADPREWMQEAGWNQDTLADFVLRGTDATAPQFAAFEAKHKALEDEVKQLRAERARSDQDRQIRDFVSKIPAALKEDKDKLPHVTAYYDTDSEMADAVWSVMRTTYEQHKRELTPLEAAHAVEKVLAEQAKRLSRGASSQNPSTTSNTAPTTKPAAPTLTNKSTASPSPAAAESDETSPNYKAAAELLRAARNKT